MLVQGFRFKPAPSPCASLVFRAVLTLYNTLLCTVYYKAWAIDYLEAHGTQQLHITGLVTQLVMGVTYMRLVRGTISGFISPRRSGY